METDWKKLLNSSRRKDKDKEKEKGCTTPQTTESRTELERDYDRILFSTPFRRLADKTQVFPLEKNDSVRTRLTHSLEVSNLCRSIGTSLAFQKNYPSNDDRNKRNIPAILGAIGLAHDLGNPPFGHQGEAAIRAWVSKQKEEDGEFFKGLNKQQRQDFLLFEGNAQTIRLLTRLQIINDDFGLNLTYGTLAALMKYTVPSDKAKGIKGKCAEKKHGFFYSEKDIVKDIFGETGLSEGERHPLTYIMEACDDIAYSVLDAEDAVKKGIASYYDLVGHLESKVAEGGKKVLQDTKDKHDQFKRAEPHLTPRELNDITMQMFRVYAIAFMVPSIVQAYKDNKEEIEKGALEKPLIDVSDAKAFCDGLKEFDKAHAYKNKRVLEVELNGFNVLSGVMDFLWIGITDRKKNDNLASNRKHPFAAYAYSRISENYRRVAESAAENKKLPLRYIELQLLTDMVSGMTDSFALSLYQELKELQGERSSI